MRRISHLLYKSLFDCLPWSIITSFARKKRWNFKNLRQIVRNSRWFPAQFLIRSRRRRRSATKDMSLSDAGAAETCSFFVSVWRNLGLAKSVTAAAKKWPRYRIFCGQIAAHELSWRRSWRLWKSWSFPICWRRGLSRRTLTRSPGSWLERGFQEIWQNYLYSTSICASRRRWGRRQQESQTWTHLTWMESPMLPARDCD